MIDYTDKGMVPLGSIPALPEGVISNDDVRNIVGFAGYIFNDLLNLSDSGGTYLARHRWYDPELGRWLERDPAGYVDGMSLYLYALSNPLLFIDPLGLDTPWNAFWGSVYENTVKGVVDLAVDHGRFAYGAATEDIGLVLSTNVGQRAMAAGMKSDSVPEALGRYSFDLAKDTVVGTVESTIETAAGIAEGDIEAIGEGLRTVGATGLGFGLAHKMTGAAKVVSKADDAPATPPTQVHHFATNKHSKYTPEMEKIAKRYDLDLDDNWNKGSVPQTGRHPDAYHRWVEEQMKRAAEDAGGDQTRFLELYERYVKDPVRRNPEMLNKSYWCEQEPQ